MSNTALDFYWFFGAFFFKESLFLSFPLFSLLAIKEKDAGEGMWVEECVMQKSNSKIAIFFGGACEKKLLKNTCKTLPLFLLGLFVGFEMNVLALFGEDSLCLCAYTDQGNTLRSSIEPLPSHGACLHGRVDSSAPTSLPA